MRSNQSDMLTERICGKCGGPLSEQHLGGLCGKCLGRLGFATFEEEEPETSPAASPVHRFGQYELIEEIGRGGMGVVYKARQMSLNRIVAVKMVLHGPFSSAAFVQRFRLEAQAAAALQHPNIVSIYEVGQHDCQHYFSMEFIEGSSLAQVAREKPLAPHRAATYVRTMAQAMQYAHERGVLHRDLKPSNVLIDARNEPRILDFGLAKLLSTDTQLTLSGQTLGSPSYMAPEQCGGKRVPISPAADIYSLGAILYYLLTSRPPFQGEMIQEVLTQVESSDPVTPRRLNADVPVDLQTICLKCLQKEPVHRYSSAQALADDLNRFLSHEPIQARPLSPAQHFWLWCRRHPVPSLLSGLLLAAVLLGFVGILWQWPRAEMHVQGETRQRRLAESSAEETRKHLYAADISLASQALQRDEYGLARRTLAGLKPKTGETDLRGFEWRYLWSLCRGAELATLTGHTWIVTCTAFSPDGRLLASGSQDGTCKVWDVAHRRLLVSLPAKQGAIWSTGFSADGAWLMAAGNLSGVRFWSTNDWKLETNFDGQLATLSRTGSLVAISKSNPLYWEATGPISLWNYRTGEKLKEFSQVGRIPALSPQNDVLAVAGPESGVYLWDTRSGELLRTLATPAPVWSIVFSPDGSHLVTAGWSVEPLVWDLRHRGEPTPLKGHSRTVWSAVYAADGTSISTVSSDQTIRFWDTGSYAVKWVLHGHENEVWCLALSADGKTLATGGKDQTVRLWNAAAPAVPDEMPNLSGNHPLFSPDSRRLITSTKVEGEERHEMWDLSRRVRVTRFPESTAVGFSSEGTRLVALNTTRQTLERVSLEGTVEKTIKLEGISEGEEPFNTWGFSPDWGTVFGIDLSGAIRFWDASSGRLVHLVQGPKPPIRAATLSGQGRYFALSVERENLVHLYLVQSGREVRLEGHRDFVSGLAFNPNASMLASGSVDGTIRLWDCATGALSGSLPGHFEETTDVAFSPDGRTLASLAHVDSLKLWHLPTLREVASIDFRQAGHCLQFAPDGSCLAVTTTQNMVRLFEAPEE